MQNNNTAHKSQSETWAVSDFIFIFLSFACLCHHSDRAGSDMLSSFCSILSHLSEKTERSAPLLSSRSLPPRPCPPRSCHLPDGRQANSVPDTTSQQMFALVQSVQTSNWIHCHVLSAAARTLGMTAIINTLVQTLIKTATNCRGLVQLAAAVSGVTAQLSRFGKWYNLFSRRKLLSADGSSTSTYWCSFSRPQAI